ncbi:hypothetical protein D029_4811B, partial [Vibrio parahaemolyticus 970107]
QYHENLKLRIEKRPVLYRQKKITLFFFQFDIPTTKH